MALYRTGTASLSADGVITGQGTKWRDPLTLIRTGATIIFLDDGIKLAVISDIISDTEMRAIATDGATATESKYVILLNDSLTVDGMAQDVAETLRYYQSRESEIGEALEFFKDFDLEGLKSMVEQVKISEANAKQSEENAKASELLAEDFKNETQSIKDSAVTEINEAKESSLREMEVVKQETFTARDEAENAEIGANQAKADSESAKLDSEAARDKAKEYADSINPDLFLSKNNNLSDVTDKEAGRKNLGFEEFGIASQGTTLAVFDWQTFTFKQGAIYNVNASSWTNAPGGLPSTSLVTVECIAVTNDDGASRRYTMRVSQINNSATRQVWYVSVYGASGSRTFQVQEVITRSNIGVSGDKIPLLNGHNTWSAQQNVTGSIFVKVQGPTNPPTASFITGYPFVSQILGRGGLADPSGCYVQFYGFEQVGHQHSANINVNGFGSNKDWIFNGSNGNTYSPLGILAVQGSDVRIKENFELPKAGAWERISKVGISEFTYRGSDVPHRGFLAQQMMEIDPIYAFYGGKDTDENGNEFEILNVNDRAVMSDMITVIQELQKRIVDLENALKDK